MVDMLKSSKDDDQRRRDESQLYTIQQQLDELRRQLKENLAGSSGSKSFTSRERGELPSFSRRKTACRRTWLKLSTPVR